VTGFRSLLSRALALSTDEVHWLKAVHVTADGRLGGLGELVGRLSQDKIDQGGVVLIAQLLGLLLTFIGEALTSRLVQQAWPKLSSGDLDF
jgi:hypothetical protein